MVFDFRSVQILADKHRGQSAARVSRIGSIIKNNRFSYPIEAGGIDFALNPPPIDFNAAQINAMQDISNQKAASVGCVKVQLSDGTWVKVGSAFRIPGGPRRMATARHLLKAILVPQALIHEVYEFRTLPAKHALRPTCVAFDNAGVDTILKIDKIIWAHPIWDLMIFDLDDDPSCPALELEENLDWGDPTLNPVCALSYPIQAKDEDPSLVQSVLGNSLGIKRISPGVSSCRLGIQTPLESKLKLPEYVDNHDVTTLPGSSGAPVISLKTGKVVGLHFNGWDLANSSSPQFRNYSINIPLALVEEELKMEMADPLLAPASSVTWNPNNISIFPFSESGLGFAGAESVFPNESSAALKVVIPDQTDFRDLYYQPPLIEARNTLLPPPSDIPRVGDQKLEPSCVGFALGAAISMQLKRLNRPGDVSVRMLYEMARLYDSFIDDSKSGSSLRGAIKGFYHSGVCSAKTAPYLVGQKPWTLSIKAANEAKTITLGGYYRLRPSLTDFQVAINEVGAVLVSANVHKGWIRPNRRRIGRIPFRRGKIGSHAFVIVGYDEKGFIILNSWGESWSSYKGRAGVAHWSYEDWAENLLDAWVIRLAPSTPDAVDLTPNSAQAAIGDVNSPTSIHKTPRVRRYSLIGHIVQIERDGIVQNGRLGIGLDTLRETALYLCSALGQEKYPRILYLFHDPFIERKTITRIAGKLIEPFKKNGIYPFHVLYGLDEILTARLRLEYEASNVSKLTSKSGEGMAGILESRARQTCGRLLNDFRKGISAASEEGKALWQFKTSIELELCRHREVHLFSAGIGSIAADVYLNVTHNFGNGPKIVSHFQINPLEFCDQEYGLKRKWALSSSPYESPELSGYNGDWIDLVSNVNGFSPVRNSQNREVKKAKSSTIEHALQETTVLNDIIRSVIGYSPSATRSFG